MTAALEDGEARVAAQPRHATADATADAVATRIAARVLELEGLFARIAATRMQGVPILHPRLAVKAVGFRPSADGAAAVGVLVTPWFMNLVWLPLAAGPAWPASPAGPVAPPTAAGAGSAGSPFAAAAESSTPVGATRTRVVGQERIDFIGAHEPGFGAYEACSLFSPMAEFEDQAAALATAEQVMALLHEPPAAAPARTAPPGAGSMASRRALLFGRAAAAAAQGRR